ncbi:MAG: hypothetical protein R3E66_04670 [bacterium]
MAESFGVLGAAAYEEAGAIRDVVQNHLMQVVGFLAMELPLRLTRVRSETSWSRVFVNLPLTCEDVVRTLKDIGTNRESRRTRTSRHSWPFASTLTRGGGTGCHFLFGPANVCPRP